MTGAQPRRVRHGGESRAATAGRSLLLEDAQQHTPGDGREPVPAIPKFPPADANLHVTPRAAGRDDPVMRLVVRVKPAFQRSDERHRRPMW
ncbi:hypothetical protein [Streptomyces sp. NPDC086182]|uniref:hypothetical protein n=1 Tax=Streptomyces sp. NPDC086182 TaxID=3155058 RepID=UPI003449753A